MPSFPAFLAMSAAFNRYTKKLRRDQKLRQPHLNLLCCIQWLHYAKNHNDMFAVQTLIHNYGTSYEQVSTLITYLFHLKALHLVTFDYTGHVKGSKIAITILGLNKVNELYQELERVVNYYPEAK